MLFCSLGRIIQVIEDPSWIRMPDEIFVEL